MYADDLVILSRSEFGLQRCLHQFNGWCNKWMMQINFKKTKIMIFQKITRKNSTQPNFFLVDNNVCITKSYCYLGKKLTSNGKFTIGLQQLAEKALHALQSIRNQLDFHLVYPKFTIKIFDNIISPILFYNSEVWGAYLNSDFNKWDKSPVEKAHLRYFKIVLGVNSKTLQRCLWRWTWKATFTDKHI